MRKFVNKKLITVLLATAVPTVSRAETRNEWITLGTRIHGDFSPFIPVGIRIGLDARKRLKAEPHGLSVIYYVGAKPPCPCIADGVMIATHASPGQGTLLVSREKLPEGIMARIEVRNRRTGEGLRYTITDDWLPKVMDWLKLDSIARYEAAMSAEGLFRSEPIAQETR